jgi:hypothetical protein
MLFDLRGRGRRNTIKIIYVSLAFLMGGGLVLFGIGGATNGGLVDAITGSDGGGEVGADRYEKEVKAAEVRIQRNPRDRVAYENLIKARVQLAGFEGYDSNADRYDEAGLALLRQAAEDWKAYQALNPPVDANYGATANRIATAFIYLEQPENYITAQEIVAEARNATGPYQQLAVAAYQLGQIRKGDLAAAKAIELASEDQRATVESDMKAAKEAAPTDQAPIPTPSATPTETATPEKTTAPKDEKPSSKDKRKPKAKKK